MATHAHTNRLIDETSPYLLQHAHNPVDWYPWSEAALAKARAENKPILLSIGYSACHWCHVMEHESFEDEEVARVMNEHFVCIKVDREERPDLDKVYQTAHQILAQRGGGWPLTVFLMPDDLMPFFAGTYFPKTPRYGMPGFVDVLLRVATAYQNQRDAIHTQNQKLHDVFARLNQNESAEAASLNGSVLEEARAELRAHYDATYGGFGGAPKFPHPTSLEFLLRYYARSEAHGHPDAEMLAMTSHTLGAMIRGGLYDQLGGGFYRYSVDERWEIPHFEKMLYDNAQLLPLCADLALVTGDTLFREAALQTAAWVMREMQAPDGGYYATLDADSEGHEGRHYVWSADEIRALLTPKEYSAAKRRYGLDGKPNFEGRWHLNVHADIEAVAAQLRVSSAEVSARLQSAHAKLLTARDQRVRPGRDEKILTSWNGLMIKGMARAGRLLDSPDLVASAERALAFVQRTLWRDERLLATAKDGRAQLNAYLDDYVFLIDGVLELLQARWRTEDAEFAVTLARTVLEQFTDEAEGGFFFTSNDHDHLIYRPKAVADEAVPSGNGVAAQVLLRLGHLIGEPRFLHAAERTLRALHQRMTQYPSGHGSLLIALDEYLYPPPTVVLRGAGGRLIEWRERLRRAYMPHHLIVAISDEAQSLPGLLAERKNIGKVTAYVCVGHTCRPPVKDFKALEKLLAESERG